MVLSRNHGHDRLSVDEGKQARFFPDHAFFDDDAAAGSAENVVFHHGIDSCNSFFFRLGYDDALAGSQTVSLDDDGCALFMNIGFGGIAVGKGFIGCRRNPVFLHEILGKDLGAFHLSRCFIGAEHS